MIFFHTVVPQSGYITNYNVIFVVLPTPMKDTNLDHGCPLPSRPSGKAPATPFTLLPQRRRRRLA